MSEQKGAINSSPADFSVKNGHYAKVRNPFASAVPEKVPTGVPPELLFSSRPIDDDADNPFAVFSAQQQSFKKVGPEISSRDQVIISPERKEMDAQAPKIQNSLSTVLAKKEALFEMLTAKNVRTDFDEKEIRSTEQSLGEEIDAITEQLSNAASLDEQEAIKEKIASLEERIKEMQDAVTVAINQRIARNEELIAPRIRIDELDRRAQELFSKIDHAQAIDIVQSFDSLSWLKRGLDDQKDTPLNEIESGLTVIENMIKAAETEAQAKEQTERIAEDNDKKEALERMEQLLPLVESFSRLQSEASRLINTKIQEADKKALTEKGNQLQKLRNGITSSVTKADLAQFKEAITEYEKLVNDIREAFEARTKNPNYVEIAWPKDRLFKIDADPKKGVVPHWVYITDNGDPESLPHADTQFWSAEQTRFSTLFSEYTNFFTTGDKARKERECVKLIEAKNKVLEALLTKDLGAVRLAQDAFKTEIEITEKAWEEMLKNEASSSSVAVIETEQEKELTARLTSIEENINNYLTPAVERFAAYSESTEVVRAFTEKLTKIKEMLEIVKTDKSDKAVSQLAALVTYFDKMVGEQIFVYSQSHSNHKLKNGEKNTAIFNSAFIGAEGDTVRLADGTEMTREAWENSQRIKKESRAVVKEMEQADRKMDSERELMQKHLDMLNRDENAYIALYMHKKWAPNDPNKTPSMKVLASHFANKRGELVTAKDILETQLAGGVLDNGETAEKINKLTSQIRSVDDTMRALGDHYSSSPKKTTSEISPSEAAAMRRETLSPARSSSFAHIPVEGSNVTKRNIIPRPRSDWRERVAYKDALKTRKLESVSANRESLSQKYIRDDSNFKPLEVKASSEGLTRILTPDEARKTKGAYKMEAHVTAPPEPKVSTLEKASNKLNLVGRFLETRMKSLSNRTKGDKLLLGLLLGTAIGATAANYTKTGTEPSKPRTLAEAVAEMSWEDEFATTPEKESFLKDFMDTDGFTSDDAIKKYAVGAIQLHNPSTITALSKMDSKNLLNSHDDIQGLDKNQRKAASFYLSTLVDIMKSIKGPNYKITDEKGSPTVEDYFKLVKAAAANARREEASFKTQ